MIDTMSIFDLLPLGEREQYLSKKSTDWKWSFKDYPKHTNGIKVFSCFACGGGPPWAINSPDARFLAA